MIVYDGKRWRGHISLRGSVITKAMPYALFPSIISFMVSYIDVNGFEPLNIKENFLSGLKDGDGWALITNSAAFSGFQFTLGFVLVFRAGQCYSRFWSCATSACVMRSQLVEAASSLIAFTAMTKATKAEVQAFHHTIVRLVSMLHAVALQNIADCEDENYRVIDPASIGENLLMELGELHSDLRVDVVYQWITNLIVKNIDTGLLAIPPPIASRVFQELEKGMIEYQQVLQTMSIPFPFPYAQVAVVLLWFYMFCVPFVMCYWVGNALFAAVMTFLSVSCYVTIEMICSELEYPLGDDANDLPTHEWQDGVNRALLGLLNPLGRQIVYLTDPVYDLEILQSEGMGNISHYLDAMPTGRSIRGRLSTVQSIPHAMQSAMSSAKSKRNSGMMTAIGSDSNAPLKVTAASTFPTTSSSRNSQQGRNSQTRTAAPLPPEQAQGVGVGPRPNPPHSPLIPPPPPPPGELSAGALDPQLQQRFQDMISDMGAAENRHAPAALLEQSRKVDLPRVNPPVGSAAARGGNGI